MLPVSSFADDMSERKKNYKRLRKYAELPVGSAAVTTEAQKKTELLLAVTSYRHLTIAQQATDI